MFKCRKCNEERYQKYEENLFKCENCNCLIRICCDCAVEQYKNNNLEIIKNELGILLNHVLDIKIIIKKILCIKKITDKITGIIMKYLNFRYIDTLNSKYYSNKIDYNIQYIKPFGLQLKEDDNSMEYYSTPIFYCLECLPKYNYYCLKYNKLN